MIVEDEEGREFLVTKAEAVNVRNIEQGFQAEIDLGLKPFPLNLENGLAEVISDLVRYGFPDGVIEGVIKIMADYIYLEKEK